jgi:sugar phosphate isomerase/epimerase
MAFATASELRSSVALLESVIAAERKGLEFEVQQAQEFQEVQNWVLKRNVESLGELAAAADQLDLRLILENLPGQFNQPSRLRLVFDAVPDLGLHLDVGHANLGTPRNLSEDLVAAFGDRLEHVHFSDNRGGDLDLHLPLGAGAIDWRQIVRVLKSGQYDCTKTLEVFSTDREYLAVSQRKVRQLWAEEPLG